MSKLKKYINEFGNRNKLVFLTSYCDLIFRQSFLLQVIFKIMNISDRFRQCFQFPFISANKNQWFFSFHIFHSIKFFLQLWEEAFQGFSSNFLTHLFPMHPWGFLMCSRIEKGCSTVRTIGLRKTVWSSLCLLMLLLSSITIKFFLEFSEHLISRATLNDYI